MGVATRGVSTSMGIRVSSLATEAMLMFRKREQGGGSGSCALGVKRIPYTYMVKK